MAEQSVRHRLRLTGEMTCQFQGQAYAISAAALEVLFDELRVPYHIGLDLTFSDPEQVAQLGVFFPGLAGLSTSPPLAFAFAMHETVLQAYREVFQEVDTLEGWITVAGGACFELGHYAYSGRSQTP